MDGRAGRILIFGSEQLFSWMNKMSNLVYDLLLG
jgi:hypothetical protein